MPQVDIAAETLAVGNAIASVRIDQMILNLAKGIAWGQYELDKVGVEITKMMGVPGTVTIGDETISMLEAGFVPSFYHFVDTILEMKMEVNIREEQASSLAVADSVKRSMTTEVGAEVGMKAGVNGIIASAEVSAKASFKNKTSSAYSRSVDAKHSQKFSQDLSATSLMRTKLVPIPAPELLVERIKILLERLRQEVDEKQRLELQKAPKDRKPLEDILMDTFTEKMLDRVDESAAKAAGNGDAATGEAGNGDAAAAPEPDAPEEEPEPPIVP